MSKNETIIKHYHDACSDLAERVNVQLFNGTRDWYWVAEEIGDTCDFGDSDFLIPEDMVLVLDNHMTYNQYAEWRDANSRYYDTKGLINLRSWLRGARHSLLKQRPRMD